MSTIYISDQTFEGSDFTETSLKLGEYEACIFKDCHFNNVDLSACNFIECIFDTCDLSMAKLNNTAFRDVKFQNCKLLGLHFEQCNDILFSVQLSDCFASLTSFYQRNLKNSSFMNCRLHEVDFTDANLNSAKIENCDLSGAMFHGTRLEKADLRSSYNFSIDPEINRIKGAKFSASTLAGLLDKYNIVVE